MTLREGLVAQAADEGAELSTVDRELLHFNVRLPTPKRGENPTDFFFRVWAAGLVPFKVRVSSPTEVLVGPVAPSVGWYSKFSGLGPPPPSDLTTETYPFPCLSPLTSLLGAGG